MAISDEKISEIRKSVNIVDMISEYIPITKKGRNYFAVCPFHDDHNPSMSISPEKQIYTCFVCGAHGNVFNFIMDYENVTFYDALRMVADKVGIHLDNVPIKKKSNSVFDKMYEIFDISNKFYQNNLLTKDGNNARVYLNNRGFTDDIINEFQVGLSTNSKLTKVLCNKGFDNDILLKSGISSGGDNGIYDTFTNRIMFPLWDINGRVVGFSGRIYNKSDTSKYINSKESEIFKKGSLIYNYHRAKEEIRKKKFVIIVEGFMDVIALYKAGIYNVVAMMGTAVTNEQAKLLKKLSTNIILCFDGDKAGEKATIACSKELFLVGVSPKIVRLPDNLDPDEFINKYGIDKYNEYISNPMSLLDYKINIYKSETNFSDSTEVSNYLKNVCLELSLIDDKIIKEITIKKLSDETNVSVPTINGMVKNKPIENRTKKKIPMLNKYEKAERRLIFYMLRYPEVIKIYERNKCYFPTSMFRFLASEIVYYYNKYGSICIADFLSYLNNKEELIEPFNLVDTMEIDENYTNEEIMDYINLLNDYSVKEEIKRLTSEFKRETDDIRRTEIAKEISNLKVSV